MNVANINFNSKIITFGLPLSIFLLAISLSLTNLLTVYPEFAVAVTYDLTLTAPLIYLFLIRKTQIPKLTVIPVFVLGVVTASLILPSENRFHLNLITTFVLPVAEIIAVTFFGITAYKSYKTYQSLSGKSADVLEILRKTCRTRIFSPRIAEMAAFEISVFYYAVLSWKKSPRENTFSYHKKSGIIALYSIIIFIVAVETLVVHILVAMWSETAAWILTALSIYFLFQLFAHLKAVLQRPFEITRNKLYLRYGLFGDAMIETENIEKIEETSAPFEYEKGAKKLALLGGLEPHNLKIELKDEIVVKSFYGIESKAKTLYLFVDEIEEFKNAFSRIK